MGVAGQNLFFEAIVRQKTLSKRIPDEVTATEAHIEAKFGSL